MHVAEMFGMLNAAISRQGAASRPVFRARSSASDAGVRRVSVRPPSEGRAQRPHLRGTPRRREDPRRRIVGSCGSAEGALVGQTVGQGAGPVLRKMGR